MTFFRPAFAFNAHPTGALPGTTVGYLWLLSGDSKAYDITTDPRYSWVAATEAVLKEMKA